LLRPERRADYRRMGGPGSLDRPRHWRRGDRERVPEALFIGEPLPGRHQRGNLWAKPQSASQGLANCHTQDRPPGNVSEGQSAS